MSQKHEQIENQVIFDWSEQGRGRLFKNDNGTAWVGKPHQTNKNNAILLSWPQKITFGLYPGSSDLIGWEFVEFTDFSANIDIPIFCSIEVKTFAHPKLTEKQINWLNNVVNIGGKGYVARETEKGYNLEEWRIK